ncbi:MAG: D-alanyl-D-alanine carboxypeptidase/D-alanyl-D-alanine-endopeptidase [Acidobacteria bacterium]|nr:D-alanyl-D-alanine carboxypeptidase/D-alanyl-D-alanine-endopeptidase [Acidobacteriota bacterium]
MRNYLISRSRLAAASLAFLAFAVIPAIPQSATPTPFIRPAVTVTDNLAAKPTASPGRSLSDLQADIRARLQRPELRRGQVGIKIVSLATGKVVFEENAEKYFMPASNMKNFTVATALEKLTPDYRFATSVYAPAMPDVSGTIKGDLRIYGRGDVSLSTAFFPTAVELAVAGRIQNGTPASSVDAVYYQGIDKLIDKIMAAGVKRIEGSIIGDDSYFKGYAIPGGWEWDDLQWYYGAEVSSLPINDSAVDLEVKPGPVGYSCNVKLTPYNPVYRVKNLCTTTPAGTPRTLRIEKELGQNVLTISGTLPVGNGGTQNSIGVSRPAELFAALLKMRLEQRGIEVTGQYRADNSAATAPSLVEIAKLESPPLALIAAKTMKPSQNMYTETLLWTLGEEARKRLFAPEPAATTSPSRASSQTRGAAAISMPQESSADLGLAEVKSFLSSIGIAPDGILQYDGSGLSRHNLITPSAVVQLYTYMAKESKYSQAWRDSLTIGGVDGTLANRFKGTAAQNNMRGKTGTIDQVSALSGYVTTAGGEPLVVSFIVNGVPTGRDRTSMMDDIVVALAKFNGKINETNATPR